jgi:hypothetical protein
MIFLLDIQITGHDKTLCARRNGGVNFTILLNCSDRRVNCESVTVYPGEGPLLQCPQQQLDIVAGHSTALRQLCKSQVSVQVKVYCVNHK